MEFAVIESLGVEGGEDSWVEEDMLRINKIG